MSTTVVALLASFHSRFADCGPAPFGRQQDMDTLTFVTGIAEALAWPLSTFGIALLFREQLIELLRSVKKGKVGPAEFEFERELKAIEAVAVQLPSARTPAHAASDATANPRGAVLDAWIGLEDQAIEFALKNEIVRPTARRNPHGAVKGILKSGVLGESSRQVLEELYNLRNLAAHDPDFNPGPDSVLAYVRLAADLGLELERTGVR